MSKNRSSSRSRKAKAKVEKIGGEGLTRALYNPEVEPEVTSTYLDDENTNKLSLSRETGESNDDDDLDSKPTAGVIGPTMEEGKNLLYGIKNDGNGGGFWAHSVLLHAHDAKQRNVDNYDQMKNVMLKDYENWVLLTALVGTAGFSILFTGIDVPLKNVKDFAESHKHALGDYSVILEAFLGNIYYLRLKLIVDVIASVSFIYSLCYSSFLAFTGITHFIAIHGYMNMVPAAYLTEARLHINNVVSTEQHYSKKILSKTTYGTQAFFYSLKHLFIGITSAVYLQHGWLALFPALMSRLFYDHICMLHRVEHWDEKALPAFRESIMGTENSVDSPHACNKSNSPRSAKY